ncbi:MAG: hypothetical protein JWM54_1401 [Acidobacteriaceae bacterium]|nr:hypothetical protein [Acidobacteriaceae bacterium]
MLTSNQRETLISWVEPLTKIRRQRPSPEQTTMGPEEWKRDADSVLASADAEDVRNALLGRLAERYAAPDGILRIEAGSDVNYGTQGLASLGVSIEDAQILAAFEYLKQLKQRASKEQFSWTRRYLQERLKVWYRGSRSRVSHLDSLIRRKAVRHHLARQAVARGSYLSTFGPREV